MSKIARYQGNVRAFASDAQGMERTVFGGTNQADDLTSQITASFLRGWGIVGASEHPSLEDFNAAMYAMSQFIAYQHQMGVPEWHAEQEYHIGSICTHNGESYQSLQNANIGSQPPSAKWTPVLTSKNGLANLGLKEALLKGDGRFLAGTFVSDAIDRTSIGARAATGCQFMRAHQAPDAPDQVSYWQIITLTEVVSPTSVVDVLAISGNNVLFGHGTGAGITSWRKVAMLEGAAFTGDISAPNMRGDTLVTVGDGSGGMATGGVDGAGFNGNNLNIKSWNGIGFQNSADLAIRAYISTRLGVIAAAENLQAGNAIFNKNGDVYGDIWGIGSGPGWLSAYIAGRPLRQYITMVGVYQNDKTKPFMLHDDGSGVFLATTDMLSGYVQSIRFGATEQGNVYRAPGFADQLGYIITGIENGDSNDTPDRIQRRLLQIKVNGQWYTVGA
ncbi:hypothetical protein AB07_0219 [Citrobacter freundii]|nr:hypothetical protein AB07_0219 [Citrobacter freundii]